MEFHRMIIGAAQNRMLLRSWTLWPWSSHSNATDERQVKPQPSAGRALGDYRGSQRGSLNDRWTIAAKKTSLIAWVLPRRRGNFHIKLLSIAVCIPLPSCHTLFSLMGPSNRLIS